MANENEEQMPDPTEQWISSMGDSSSSNTIQNLVYSILYSTVSLAAIGGNGVVIYLIINFRRMRSVTDLFILNLAFGDLLMAILCIPFTFTSNLLFHGWPFGSIMCRVVSYAQAVCVFISAYTLVAISIDRYIAIIYPLRPRMTKRYSQYLIGFIWLVALLTPLPTALLSRLVLQTTVYDDRNLTDNANISNEEYSTGFPSLLSMNSSFTFSTIFYHSGNRIEQRPNETTTNATGDQSSSLTTDEIFICTEDWNENNEYKSYYSVLLMVLQYILPFTVLVFTYSRIGLMIWGRQTPGEAHGGRDARIAASKRKMVKMMITCVVTFTLCWLPLNIFIVIGDRYPEIFQYEHIEYVWVACHWLAMSHASYNPFIYIWMNARFRSGFRYVIRRFCCCRWNSQHSHSDDLVMTMDPSRRYGKNHLQCATSFAMSEIQTRSIIVNHHNKSVQPNEEKINLMVIHHPDGNYSNSTQIKEEQRQEMVMMNRDKNVPFITNQYGQPEQRVITNDDSSPTQSQSL